MSKRIRFFLLHLASSFVIISCIYLFIHTIWYPEPLNIATGVNTIILILFAVDVIIGPLLGFIVYKEKKKSLKFDLFVIISIQIAALLFGVYSLAQARPAWIVYNTQRFELVRNNELLLENKDVIKAEFKHVSWLGPRWAAVKVAKDVEQKNNDLFLEALGGISLSQKPERFIPLSDLKQKMVSGAYSLEMLLKFNHKNVVNEILKQYPQSNAWLPLKANAVDMVVLINKEKAEVIKIVDLRPWN